MLDNLSPQSPRPTPIGPPKFQSPPPVSGKPNITIIRPSQPAALPVAPPKAKLPGWILGLIVLALIVVVYLILVSLKKPNQANQVPASTGNSQSTNQTSSATPVQHVAIPAVPAPLQGVNNSQLPAGFPADFPIETGATVTSNFTQAFSNNNVASGRDLQSSKSADEEFNFYLNYFTTAGWKVITKDQGGVGQTWVFVVMNQSGQQATVTVYQASATALTQVNISFLTPKQ